MPSNTLYGEKHDRGEYSPAPTQALGISCSSQRISQADASIEVPRSIISSLKFLIGKRKKCNGWFSDQSGDESHEMKNQSHDHAISTLEKILCPLSLKTPAPKISSTSASQKDEHEPLNTFAALSVEPALDVSDDEDIYKKFNDEERDSPPLHEHLSGPCQGCIQADLAFECFCFYGDFHRYREYLSLIWERYRDGELDLMTASGITDTAFDILERAENEFCPDFSMLTQGKELESLPKYERTAGYLYMKYCPCYSQDPGLRERAEDDINMAMYATAEWLCIPTSQTVHKLFFELKAADSDDDEDESTNMFPFGDRSDPKRRPKIDIPWNTGRNDD